MDRRTFLAGTATFLVGGVGGWVGKDRFGSDPLLAVDCDCPSAVRQHRYDAELVAVVDGDTVDVLVDLGLDTLKEARVRIADIDTAEYSEDEALAEEQAAFVRNLLTDADSLIFQSDDEKGGFGRWLGDINADGVWLSEAVLERWPDAEYEK